MRIRIPSEMKPSHMLVSLAKSTIEDQYGEIRMSWGKFVALLGLCGALAVDSVEAGYPDGVAEIVETFGIIVEQAMGDWILTKKQFGGGGGWDGFITLNVYKARIPPVTRTVFIIFMFLLTFYFLYSLIVMALTMIFQRDTSLDFWWKWYTVYPDRGYCHVGFETFFETRKFISLSGTCPNPNTPLQYLYALKVYRDSLLSVL